MRTIPDEVLAHWAHLYEGLNTSPQGFYADLRMAIERRRFGAEVSHVEWSEGGVLSPNREYMRVTGDRQIFDVCAAPFGTGFFFSWWLTAKRPRHVLFYFLLWAGGSALLAAVLAFVVGAFGQALYGSAWGILFQLLPLVAGPFVLLPLCGLIGLWLIALAARSGTDAPGLAIETIPVLGWLYRRLFNPETYYRLDTMQMFRTAVHGAVMETIDQLTSAKGLRALNADERKPVFRELLHGGGGVTPAPAPPPVNMGPKGQPRAELVGA